MEDTEYIEYSLENTVRILEERTRHRSNIFVVRADRMNQSLSEWEMMLTPGRGIAHMAALLQNALEQLCTKHNLDFQREKLPICLFAFSKGVVVLNHFLAEYATLVSELPPKYIYDWQDPENRHHIYLPSWEPSLRIERTKTPSDILYQNKSSILSFIQRLESIHYLDGHRFPTNPIVIDHLVSLLQHSSDRNLSQSKDVPHFSTDKLKCEDIKTNGQNILPHVKLFIHCTPRQIKDPKRPWIGQEYSVFKEELKKRGVVFFNKIYFGNERRSLENHFKILTVFEINFVL
jgi:hypothetical protein